MKRNIYFDFGYLITLCATFGAVLTLGIIVAPVVFHSDIYTVNVNISHYNMGLIMSEIFRRFGYWLYFVALYVAVYEAVDYKMGNRDKITILSAFIVLFSSLMFVGVYMPKILAYQAGGEAVTKSEIFTKLHLASEIDFKILALSLIVLFVRRLMLLRRL